MNDLYENKITLEDLIINYLIEQIQSEYKK